MIKKIGPYNIKSKIASGGMANIYLATDRQGKKAAIKFLKEEIQDKEKISERFAQEGLLKLDHPNIVKVNSIGTYNNTPYIVMDYIEGKDLEDYIKKNGPLPLNIALNIFTQMLSALSYVHAKGIIHRDIKPKNILIDKKGVAKLTDFGIAKSLYSHIKTSTGGYLGAPAYSSPEQMDGKKVDARSDIYSLGVTLYQMLTGSIPYSSSSIEIIIKEKFLNQVIPIEKRRKNIPPYIVSIINKSISKNPSNRFHSVEEITQIVRSKSDSKETIVRPTRLMESKEKKGLSTPKIAGILIGAIAIVAITVVSIMLGINNVSGRQVAEVETVVTSAEEAVEEVEEAVEEVAEEVEEVVEEVDELVEEVVVEEQIVSVTILNGVGNPGLGSEVSEILKEHKYKNGSDIYDVREIGNAENFNYNTTEIRIYDLNKLYIMTAADKIIDYLGTGNIITFEGDKTNSDIIIILGADYSSEAVAEEPYNIGDSGPAGGVIFYVNPNYEVDGWRYLEVAPANTEWSGITWSNITNKLVGTSTMIGTGEANTVTIINQPGHINSAAKQCNDLIVKNYDDWFLPSKDELNLIYQNLYLKGLGDLRAVDYWSSSEYDLDDAYVDYVWWQNFRNGYQDGLPKYGSYNFRAVRAFK